MNKKIHIIAGGTDANFDLTAKTGGYVAGHQ